MENTYMVTAVNSENRVVTAKAIDESSALKTAKTWWKDVGLRSVQIISRDEYGRGHVMAREICYAHGDACSSDCRFRVFRVVGN